MENSPKVLVGCPTYDGQKFCFEEFVTCLKSLSYPNFDVLFVDNSTDEIYSEMIRGYSYEVIHHKPEAEDRIGIIVENRNIVINRAIEKKYDYLFFLDTDVICPKDIIERLLAHKKDIVSGIYLMAQDAGGGVIKIFPKLLGFSSYKEYGKRIKTDDVREDKLIEVYGAGFGCVLIKREVLEKVKLRYNKELGSGEDFIFCYDAREKSGYKTYVDTILKCKHISRSGVLEF